MSIYVSSVTELAKKRNVPVADLVDHINNLGMKVTSKTKLTQKDLDKLGTLENPSTEVKKVTIEKEEIRLANANVIIVRKDNKHLVFLVDALVDDQGNPSIRVIEKVEETNRGLALLEYQRLRGINNVEGF